MDDQVPAIPNTELAYVLYWQELRNATNFNFEFCINLANTILLVNFQKHKFACRNLVQIWLRLAVQELSRSLTGYAPDVIPTYPDMALVHIVTAACRNARTALYSNSTRPEERKTYILAYLGQFQSESLERRVYNELSSLPADDISSMLKKKQDILAQAAMAVLLFVRWPHVVSQYEVSMHQFIETYNRVQLREGKLFFRDPQESKAVLYWNAVFMHICKLFIPAHRAKGRYMTIAAAVVEARPPYVTGGGSFPASQRREKLFEHITGVQIIHRQQRKIDERGSDCDNESDVTDYEFEPIDEDAMQVLLSDTETVVSEHVFSFP